MLRLPGFSNKRLINLPNLSALHSGRLYTQMKIPGVHFNYRLSQLHGHNAPGRIKSMKNLKNPSGNEPVVFGL